MFKIFGGKKKKKKRTGSFLQRAKLPCCREHIHFYFVSKQFSAFEVCKALQTECVHNMLHSILPLRLLEPAWPAGKGILFQGTDPCILILLTYWPNFDAKCFSHQPKYLLSLPIMILQGTSSSRVIICWSPL